MGVFTASAQRPQVESAGRSLGTDSATVDSSTVPELGSIVYNSKEESNEDLASLVHVFHYRPWAVKIEKMLHPDMEPTRVAYPNALDALDDFYLGRGYGQVHYSLYYQPTTELRFCFLPDPFRAFSHTVQNLRFYQTRRPFTSLTYNSSIHEDFCVRVNHTQNIMPRWNFALNADFVKRDGVYTQDAVKDENLNFSTNYYSRDSRYQLQAGIIHTTYHQEENGGVLDDSTCWLQTTRSGVAVELYKASNRWRNTAAFVHQSYNTVSQLEQLHPIRLTDVSTQSDSIIGYDTVMPARPRVFNTGVIGWDLQYVKQKHNYYDGDPTHFSYHFVDTARTLDSTTTYLLTSRFYWTNDAYMHTHWHNPWIITLGITPEMAWMPTLSLAEGDTVPTFIGPNAIYQQYYISVNPFFSSHWRLGNNAGADIEGEMVCGSYRNGDYQLQASLSSFIGKRLQASLHAITQAQQPDFFYYQFSGNNAHWYYDKNFYNKQHTNQLKARAQLLRRHLSGMLDGDLFTEKQSHTQYSVDSTSDMLSTKDRHLADIRYWQRENQQPLLAMDFSVTSVDNIIINDGDPTAPFHQYADVVLLLQASLRANLSWRWLHWDMLHMLQHTNRLDRMDVPTFATKNSFYADFPVFNGAMRLQTGLNLRYFTSFHADGWKPYYGMFTHQDDVTIGNYLWSDLFLTAQIKQVSFYVKVAHWNSLSFLAPESREILSFLGTTANYFTLPHYPGEDLNIYWGITWKFFN